MRAERGFSHQYEDRWLSIHGDKVPVGRALTAQCLPGRPDIHKVIEEQGKKDGRIGGQNAWAFGRRQTSATPSMPRAETASSATARCGTSTG